MQGLFYCPSAELIQAILDPEDEIAFQSLCRENKDSGEMYGMTMYKGEDEEVGKVIKIQSIGDYGKPAPLHLERAGLQHPFIAELEFRIIDQLKFISAKEPLFDFLNRNIGKSRCEICAY